MKITIKLTDEQGVLEALDAAARERAPKATPVEHVAHRRDLYGSVARWVRGEGTVAIEVDVETGTARVVPARGA